MLIGNKSKQAITSIYHLLFTIYLYLIPPPRPLPLRVLPVWVQRFYLLLLCQGVRPRADDLPSSPAVGPRGSRGPLLLPVPRALSPPIPAAEIPFASPRRCRTHSAGNISAARIDLISSWGPASLSEVWPCAWKPAAFVLDACCSTPDNRSRRNRPAAWPRRARRSAASQSGFETRRPITAPIPGNPPGCRPGSKSRSARRRRCVPSQSVASSVPACPRIADRRLIPRRYGFRSAPIRSCLPR